MDWLWDKLVCDIMTPLGSEVDPEVYWRKAIDVDEEGSWLLNGLRCRWPSIAIHLQYTRYNTSMIILWNTYRSVGHDCSVLENIFRKSATRLAKLYSACVKATVASELRWMDMKWWISFFWRRGSGGKTGTAMRPHLKHASNVTVKVRDGKNTSSTRSPGDSLHSVMRKWARCEEAFSSSCESWEEFQYGHVLPHTCTCLWHRLCH